MEGSKGGEGGEGQEGQEGKLLNALDGGTGRKEGGGKCREMRARPHVHR